MKGSNKLMLTFFIWATVCVLYSYHGLILDYCVRNPFPSVLIGWCVQIIPFFYLTRTFESAMEFQNNEKKKRIFLLWYPPTAVIVGALYLIKKVFSLADEYLSD